MPLSAFADESTSLARSHYEKGDALMQEGKYLEAQEEFKKGLEVLTLEKQLSPAAGAVAEQEPASEAPKTSSGVKEYIISQEDVLDVHIWQSPDLNQEITVRPGGGISFPLAGNLQAGGLTIPQLEEQFKERLKEYIKNPGVSILLKKIGGKRVVVIGDVIQPGAYELVSGTTVMQAIGLAQGFTRDAVPSSTLLIRGGLSSTNIRRLNLSRLLTKGEVSENPELQSEDIIFVPKKFISDVAYILNQIIDPLSKGMYADERWKAVQELHRKP